MFENYSTTADELRLPFYQYIALTSRSMLAVFSGRFEEAEKWAQQALAFGARMPTLDAAAYLASRCSASGANKAG